MKNKLITIILAVACIAASCIPTAVLNAPKVVTEKVNSKEAYASGWQELTKGQPVDTSSDAYIKAYQEAYDQAYQKYYDYYMSQQQAAADYQNKLQQNITDTYNNNVLNSNTDIVVSDISADADGNLIVTYSNGVSKTIAISSDNPTPTPTPTHDYEQVGYEAIVNLPEKSSGHYSGFNCSFDYSLTDAKMSLTKVNGPTQYDPYSYFIYELNVTCSITNLTFSTSNPSTFFEARLYSGDKFICELDEFRIDFNNSKLKNNNVTIQLTSPISNPVDLYFTPIP